MLRRPRDFLVEVVFVTSTVGHRVVVLPSVPSLYVPPHVCAVCSALVLCATQPAIVPVFVFPIPFSFFLDHDRPRTPEQKKKTCMQKKEKRIERLRIFLGINI